MFKSSIVLKSLLLLNHLDCIESFLFGGLFIFAYSYFVANSNQMFPFLYLLFVPVVTILQMRKKLLYVVVITGLKFRKKYTSNDVKTEYLL